MNDAIEVLKDKIETIKLVNREILDETQWRDFLGKEITPERRDIINKRINALEKALLALEFFDWIKKQKKKCEKDLMLYGDYYNKLLLVETVYQWYKKELEGGEQKQ